MNIQGTMFDGKIRPTRFEACQEPDGNGSDIQELVIVVENCATGDLKDHYLVIKTERWAIDPEEIDELAVKLKEIYKQATME